MESKDYFEKEYGANHIASVIELKDEVSIYGLMDEFAESKIKSFRTRVIEELEGMKKSADEYVNIFKEQEMKTSELCSSAMRQAYNNAIERVENFK